MNWSLKFSRHALCSMRVASFRNDVTVLTRSPRKRRMEDVLEKFRVFRSMRVMAMPAVNDTRVYIDVSLSKSWPFVIVAFPA